MPTSSRSPDRKSIRLNSSHVEISYAVFCLKKKKHAQSCAPRCEIRDLAGGLFHHRERDFALLHHLLRDLEFLHLLLRGQVVHHFFFKDTATPEIYTLSLHDALPI